MAKKSNIEKASVNAAQFARNLEKMAVEINAEFSTIFRRGILGVYGSIIKRSPVRTGAYRASHGIANEEPQGSENIKNDVTNGPAFGTPITAEEKQVFEQWTWKPGDGIVWLYNNQPYAERIENGWSEQAGQGVYHLALAEANQEMEKAIKESK